MIKIYSSARPKEPYVTLGLEEYTKRLRRFGRIELLLFKDEAELFGRIKNKDTMVLLDERGEILSSRDLADYIKDKSLSRDMCFLIGPPEGFSEEVKARSDLVLSLSRLTFTSQMALLLLYEQIYRAYTIIKGVGYHR